ncbi:MAG: acetyl-CoA carboxylase biotin carboxyl carrier protein [Thermoanaerobaculia bacterium]
MNVKEIKELIDLVSRRGLAGLEVERAGFRLRIEGPRPEAPPQRRGAVYDVPSSDSASNHEPAPGVSPRSSAALSAAPAAAVPAPAAAAPDEGHHVVTSPIVGTFYRSSNPDSEPFVKVGDVVEKGKTLCIVEAMKLMNEIEADAAGTISAIYPQNGQPIEFGEKLFAIQLR